MNTTDNSTDEYLTLTVGKIVAKDYRKAMVFKSHGIDFCCGGNISLQEAANEQSVSLNQILAELHAIDDSKEVETDYNNWSIKQLIDHIIHKHHTYVINVIEQLTPMLNKVELVHGNWRPELSEINRLFKELSRELLCHMQKEERILFPAILELEKGNLKVSEPFGTVQNQINIMEQEHDVAGDLMKKIDILSENYTPPKGACATYNVVFKVLNEFEQDLHTHIHLENNILFPRAIQIEQNR